MPCSCSHARCECGDVCPCCPADCFCTQCFNLRRFLKLQHCTCGPGMCASNSNFRIPRQSNRNESVSYLPTTHDVPVSSHQNPNINISKLKECHVTEKSPEQNFSATGFKWTESSESEMMITKDIPGCSYHSKYVSKQEESQKTDSASYAVSLSEDEYASESLPSLSNSSSCDSLSSSFSVSPQPPTPPLSTSAPATYDLPELTELESSEQKMSSQPGTSKISPTSNVSKSETVRISDSHPIENSRTSSESSSSIEVLPDNMTYELGLYTFHGEPGIPSIFLPSFQLNNTVREAESKKAGTSQTLSTSNSLKLSNPEVSKSDKRSPSGSDSSIEIISREEDNDKSEEGEGPTNKLQKKK